MQTATRDQTRRSHSTTKGVSLKKLRHIAEALNREYLKTGGATELDLTTEAVRSAIGDSVAKAFEVLKAMERGSIPGCLLVLLPDDEAAFELRCRNQPQHDPVDLDLSTSKVPNVDMGASVRHGHCPRCHYRFTVPGETCPNCDPGDDDDLPVAQAPIPIRPTHDPQPAEGFQFCPMCHIGEALIGGGKCSNCGEYIDPHESTFPRIKR